MADDIFNSWEIEARVVKKSNLIDYKGGKLFNVNLEDDIHKKESIS
jgi:hypothetical protein